jgi:hypothetical protein
MKKLKLYFLSIYLLMEMAALSLYINVFGEDSPSNLEFSLAWCGIFVLLHGARLFLLINGALSFVHVVKTFQYK